MWTGKKAASAFGADSGPQSGKGDGLRSNKQKLPCRMERTGRLDVVQMYKECPVEEKCGFYIETKGIPAGGAVLVFASKERKAFYAVNTNRAAVWTKKGGRYLEKGIAYYRAHGVSALGAKVYRKFFTDKEKPVDYQKWIKKHLPGPGSWKSSRRRFFRYGPYSASRCLCTGRRRSIWRS